MAAVISSNLDVSLRLTRSEAGKTEQSTFSSNAGWLAKSSFARAQAAALSSYVTWLTASRDSSFPWSRATVSGLTGSVRYTATWTLPVSASVTRLNSREMSSASPNRNSAMYAVDMAANATMPLRRSPVAVSRK